MKTGHIFIIVILSVFLSCDTSFTGSEIDNELPDTYLIIDTIIRIGEDRLDSQVELKWWSDDVDGFVKGYEFTFDEIIDQAQWQYTVSQDSTFLLSTPPGSDTIDYKFTIRAIDNLNAKDPTPASIYIPVKNTAPTINFINEDIQPALSFPAFKVFWLVDDKDGFENIDFLQIGLNDSVNNLLTLSKNSFAATFVIEDNSNDAKIYLNNSLTPETNNISGFLLNDTNRVYIRAIDKSEAKSNFTVSKSIFIKEQQTNTLLIDAYFFNGAPVIDFYKSYLDSIGINDVDQINLFEVDYAGNKTQASVDNLTQSRVFNLFDKIIWVGNEPEENLVLAQRTTFDFFNKGGKMLMSLKIGSTFDEQLDVSDFTPIESFVVPVDTTLLLESEMSINPGNANYPALSSTAFVSPVKPFNINVGASILYEGSLTARKDNTNDFSPWTGNSTIVASKNGNDGNPNFIFSCVELHQLNGNFNFDELLQQILIEEFGE